MRIRYCLQLFLYLLLPFISLAQADLRIGRHYFKEPALVKPCDATGKLTANAPMKQVEEDWQFEVVKVLDDGYVISFFKWTVPNESSGRNKASVDQVRQMLMDRNDNLVRKDGQKLYFKITKVDYLSSCARLEKRWGFTVAASTTLIKYRPGGTPNDTTRIFSDISNDFNLGLMAGYKFKPNRNVDVTHSILGGVGFALIGLDKVNTKDFLTTSVDQGALAFSAAYVLEIDKFQISIATGIDLVTGEAGRHWIYRNRPWLGIGFGYSIIRGKDHSGSTQ